MMDRLAALRVPPPLPSASIERAALAAMAPDDLAGLALEAIDRYALLDGAAVTLTATIEAAADLIRAGRPEQAMRALDGLLGVLNGRKIR